MTTLREYDLFVSYAREDGEWVRNVLYERLAQCRGADGRRLRIFLDVSDEGIQPGQDFVEALSVAIQSSRHFIPVYTHIYFQKPMCKWEVKKAWSLDPVGELGKLSPVLLEPAAALEVPFAFSHIQYVSVELEDWFERLIRSLGLTEESERRPARLEFVTQPSDALVGRVLAPVEVAVVDVAGSRVGATEVTLALEEGPLAGQTVLRATDGLATFAKLEVATVRCGARLVATADGLEPCRSDPFAVIRPVEATAQATRGGRPRTEVRIARQGEAHFFGGAPAALVLGADSVGAWALDGRPLLELPLGGAVRRVRVGTHLAAVAEWTGRVHVLGADGGGATTPCPVSGDDAGFQVPGDVCIAGGAVYVGYWSGEIVRLSPGSPPTVVARHEAGVQSLVVQGAHLAVVGLDGVLAHYTGQGAPDVEAPLPEPVRWLAAFEGCVVGIGEQRLFHYRWSRGTVIAESPGLGRIVDAATDCPVPAILDEAGVGIRFDGDLAIRARFGATPGTRLVAADALGRAVALRHPDGSRSLLLDGRVAYTHRESALAISRDGNLVAVGGPEGVRIDTTASVVGAGRP